MTWNRFLPLKALHLSSFKFSWFCSDAKYASSPAWNHNLTRSSLCKIIWCPGVERLSLVCKVIKMTGVTAELDCSRSNKTQWPSVTAYVRVNNRVLILQTVLILILWHFTCTVILRCHVNIVGTKLPLPRKEELTVMFSFLKTKCLQQKVCTFFLSHHIQCS